MTTISHMLVADEGTEYRAYPDPLTKNDPVRRGAPWTIGVGHTGAEVHEGLVWSEAQVALALAQDVAEAERECSYHFKWYEALDEVRKAVVTAMCFQMGIDGLLHFVNTLAAVGAARYADAAHGIRESKWAHETPKRAIRMAEQMETGRWDPYYTKD